jgi:hypothetical protein
VEWPSGSRGADRWRDTDFGEVAVAIRIPMKVLAVDDNPSQLLIVRKQLEHLGHV